MLPAPPPSLGHLSGAYQKLQMSSRFQFEHEMPHSMLTEEDLADDSIGIIPMSGLQTPKSLKLRFVERLERFLCLKVTIEEDTTQGCITIILTRGTKALNEGREPLEGVRSLLNALEDILSRIAKGTNRVILPASDRERACGQLYDELLIYTYEASKSTIKAMWQIFKDNQALYDDLVTRMFGINEVDPSGSTIDSELGSQLISLYQKVRAYNNSMKETNALINFASQMTRVIMHLQDRLRGLLCRARFAGEMYRLICELGFPERVYSTLVRAAALSQTFQKVTFHLPPATAPKRVSFVSPTESPASTHKVMPRHRSDPPLVPPPSLISLNEATLPPPARFSKHAMLQVATRKSATALPKPASSPIPALKEKSKRLKRFESACITVPVQIDRDDPLEAARPYLHHSDRALSIIRLEPASKQLTTHLVATVLRGAILPEASEAWYQFGFVATKDEDEERHLAGLYATILKESRNPEAVFRNLVKAVETNSLVQLFDMNEYNHFRQAFPHLEHFLTTPPAKRPTVWRLKQFVHSDQTVEPPACLQRDYGFKYCRHREEVERLKAVYAIMLRRIGPMKIHSYCTVNRLYEEGIVKTGIPMNATDSRLMQNDYMSPFVGFDNDLGLAAYRGSFFRRPLTT